MILLAVIKPLFSSKERREVLLAVTAAYTLVQLSSLPLALALPSLSDYFDTSIDNTAWIVIMYLLVLGSLVLLAARLGDRFGHSRIFFLGILTSTFGSVLLTLSDELWQMVVWRSVTGLGSALIMGNANAILASVFTPEERGRAFAIPIIGARFGTLLGLALFGLFLQFLVWRWIFATFLPMGIICIVLALPIIRHRNGVPHQHKQESIDWLGALLLIGSTAVLILSGTHLHGGEESFVTSDGLAYHLPMHGLFLLLLIFFVLVELRSSHPVMPMVHFKRREFSLALGSNVAYHFSMLATMTLVPILVEQGFGKTPIFVTLVLLPSQALGLFMPILAGWIFDKYHPPLLRSGALISIAGGFLLLGLSAPHVSFWVIPLLMIPISIGTNMFNPINNATVMNSLPVEHRGIASGMLETTREIGHALGATAAASTLAFSLPAAIELLSEEASRTYFVEGFKVASLMVVLTLLIGGFLAYFHKQHPPLQASD